MQKEGKIREGNVKEGTEVKRSGKSIRSHEYSHIKDSTKAKNTAKSNVADTTHPADVEKVKEAIEVKPGRKSITLQIHSHVALSYRLLCYL